MTDWGRVSAILLLAAGMAAAQPAAAASLSEAQSLYTLGNYRAAALAGTALETPESLALAARARLVRAAYLLPRERAVAELHAAETLARRSLEIEPEQVEAALNLAIILGYRTRVEGYVNSYFAGRAEEARDLIAGAESLDPMSGWARLVAGAWNTEVIIGAGAGLADSLFGATREKAVAAFEDAVALDEDNPTVRLEYAKALIKLYGHEGWQAARGHLEHALTAEPDDRLDTLMQAQARELLGAIKGGEPQAVVSALQEIDPFSAR